MNEEEQHCWCYKLKWINFNKCDLKTVIKIGNLKNLMVQKIVFLYYKLIIEFKRCVSEIYFLES